MKKYHKFFYDRNIPVDVIPARADFSGYKVVILPQMIVTDPRLQQRLKDFVQQGGIALLTYRDFVKDLDNNLVLGKQLPLDFDDFAGVCVAETESLQEGQDFPLGGEGDWSGAQGQGGIFRDMLLCSDAQVLLRYRDPFYGEYAALTRKAQQKGWVYYLGCGVDQPLLARLLEEICTRQGIAGEKTAPGVEVVYRGSGKDRIRMVMNHNAGPADYRGRTLEPFQCTIEPAE